MLSLLQNLEFGFNDLLDIVVVWICFAFTLRAFRKTRGVQILQGIAVILALVFLAHLLRLETLKWLLNWFFVSLAVVIPVVFQPELRRFLMRIGQQGFVPNVGELRVHTHDAPDIFEELAYSATSLSNLRYGALVVLEQETGLEEFVETGQVLDSVLSAKLLVSLFQPKSPLHDGAVIIREGRIMAAGCYLDLTSSRLDPAFGTRHRAAIGIAEQSDCVVLVISEETGDIRLAKDGNFSKVLKTEGEIKKALNQYLTDNKGEENKNIVKRLLRKGRDRAQS